MLLMLLADLSVSEHNEPVHGMHTFAGYIKSTQQKRAVRVCNHIILFIARHHQHTAGEQSGWESRAEGGGGGGADLAPMPYVQWLLAREHDFDFSFML
jgi:hypothetical protein